MNRRTFWIAAAGVVAAVVLGGGCPDPSARLNAPPHGVPERTSEMQGTFVYMTDNALLSDMSVSDIHFLPHRPQLSALGRQRLSRLASLMEAYGGTLRLSLERPEEDLAQKRLETVKNFLAEAGINTTSEVVRADLPGGRGMAATDAILIKVNEGSYKPKKDGADSASAAGGGPGGQSNP